MQVRNTLYHRSLPFEQYLQLPGISYSSIKGFEGEPTPGMSLGTKVHNYLLEPQKYQHDEIATVSAIARALRSYVGEALNVLEKEVAFTSEFVHNGMVLPYKGRADLLKAGRLVIDLKVLSGYVAPAIARFGYDKQLAGYMLATGADTGLIIAYNRTAKKVEPATIRIREELTSWWEYQVVHRGEPDTINIQSLTNHSN